MNIIIARKPLEGNCVANVLKHGTGGICIDKCRVEMSKGDKGGHWTTKRDGEDTSFQGGWKDAQIDNGSVNPNGGRFPANVIQDGSLDELFPESVSTGGKPKSMGAFGGNGVYGKAVGKITANAGGLGDSGKTSRFFYNIGEK